MFAPARALLRVKRSGPAVDHPGEHPLGSSSPLLTKLSNSVRRVGRMARGRVTPPCGGRGARLLGMDKRKLLIVLATAGVALAVLGPATKTASAEQRTLLVTLLGGQQMTVTVDVPPGTPVDQIKIPGVSTPIVAVQDITPQQPQPTTQSQAPVQVQVNPSGQKPSQPSSSSGSGSSGSGSSSNSSSDSKDSKSSSTKSGSSVAPTEG